MQSRTTPPIKFINVFSSEGKFWSEGEVLTSHSAAVEDAEDTVGNYEYTLSDVGVLDLSAGFSEEWHARRARDAESDRRVKAAKEERFAMEGR